MPLRLDLGRPHLGSRQEGMGGACWQHEAPGLGAVSVELVQYLSWVGTCPEFAPPLDEIRQVWTGFRRNLLEPDQVQQSPNLTEGTPHRFGRPARRALSWCRRNGGGDRHSIGELRRAASLSLALSACAAESCSTSSRSWAPCVEVKSTPRSTQLCAPSPPQYRRSDVLVAAPCAAKADHAALDSSCSTRR